MRLEVTGQSSGRQSRGPRPKVETGLKVDLEGVEVRGTVIGLPGEEGDWAYPSALRLGTLAGVPVATSSLASACPYAAGFLQMPPACTSSLPVYRQV